ncbi:MAG: response regulator transcription factor [Saprospiraceae bacterium]
MLELKVGLIDDHNLFIKGFAMLLKGMKTEFNINVVIESQTDIDFLHKLNTIEADLIFVDLNLETSDGIELIKIIKKKSPAIKVIVVSMIKESKFIRESFKVGADGYISKETNVEDVAKAIEKVMKGEIYFGKGIETINKKSNNSNDKQNESNLNRFNARFHLTKRELEILEMLIEGKTSKDISSILFISKDTVNVHRKNLMKKLNISNVVMLVKIVKDYNII